MTGNGGRVILEDQGDGTYTGNEQDQGIVYTPEDTSIDADTGDTRRSLHVNAPPAANTDIASPHAVGQPLSIDISAAGLRRSAGGGVGPHQRIGGLEQPARNRAGPVQLHPRRKRGEPAGRGSG